jgi:hypothetical protein
MLRDAMALQSYDPNTRAGRDALEAHRDAAVIARLDARRDARLDTHPAPTATAEGRADLVLGWGGFFAWLVKLDRGKVRATIERLKHRTGLDRSIARYLARGWSVGVVGSMAAGVHAHQAALYVLVGERASEPEDEDLAIEEGHERLALAFARRAFDSLDVRAPCSFAQLVAQLAEDPGWQIGLLYFIAPAR